MKIFVFFIFFTALNAAEISNFKLNQFESDKNFNLEQALKTKKVVINFWAEWCTSCIKEIPDLHELKIKYGDDFHFVAINAGDKSRLIKKFIKRYMFNYSILEDPDKTFSKSIGVTSLPQTWVIGTDKEILYKEFVPPKDLEKFK